MSGTPEMHDTITDALDTWLDCDGSIEGWEECATCPLNTTTEWEELSICGMFNQIRDALCPDVDQGAVVDA